MSDQGRSAQIASPISLHRTMMACAYVHECIREIFLDSSMSGFLGTVVIGSVAYLGDQAEGCDVDIIMLTTRDWPTGCGSLEKLCLLLKGNSRTSAWTAFVVKARVPILKCSMVLDGKSWSIDILHTTIAADGSENLSGNAVTLKESVDLLPTNAAVGLAATLHTHFDRTPSFSRKTLVLVRQWAKNHHVYGSTVGYPGGSAWAVLLFICCTVTVSPTTVVTLRAFLLWLCDWLTHHSGLPITVHNARILNEGGSVADHADWVGLRHSICRYARVMCILPFPKDAVDATTHQRLSDDCDINMTTTVGPLQHGVLLHELRCSIKALSDTAILTATEHETPDLLLVFSHGEAECCVARWISHIEARGLLLLTNQLHLHGLCARILQQPTEVQGELPFRVAMWLDATQLDHTGLSALINEIFFRVEYQYRQEHQRAPPCSLTVRALHCN